MMDFNSSHTKADQLIWFVDEGLKRTRDREPGREYLGASRVGVSCERALQYEFAKAQVDTGRQPEGRMLRIFERGHVMEDCMIKWLRDGGFDVRTRNDDGEQYGFEAAGGALKGHVDGVVVSGPVELEGFGYPALWECKCLGGKSWRDLQKNGMAVSKPVYAAQVAIYQAYLELHEHPAIFTALNADTMDIYVELVPFDGALAQAMSDRAVKVIEATRAQELLPRRYHDKSHFECRFCSWQRRCWKE